MAGGHKALRVVYGDCLDSGAWPPVAGESSFGSIVVGPAGLLNLVETFAGLAGPSVPAARRIAAMHRRLATDPVKNRFWSASFAVDSWAVARELLAWRDELTEAGWTPGSIASPPRRLADLAAVEESPDVALPSGVGDRLLAAASAITTADALPIAEILVVDDKSSLRPGVARLFDALGAAGAAIVYRPEPAAPAAPDSDLGRVQAWLRSGKMERLMGDGTFVLVEANSEAAASEAVAGWLAAGHVDDETVVVLGSGTGLLDAALARRGLPAFAHLPASPLRGAVQVLSLAFALRWRPFDPSVLLDLLSLPMSPIPGAVARPLSAALTEAPGRDGTQWKQAIEHGVLARRAKLVERGVNGKELERRLELDRGRWLPWIAGELFEEAPGIPATLAREICGRVAAWSARLAGTLSTESVTYGSVVAAGAFATTLSSVIDDAGLDPVPRVQLERMIDAVVADGIDASHAVAEAASWSHAVNPGHIWSSAGSVVWWGCGSTRPSRSPVRWTGEEVLALRAANCPPEADARTLAREAAEWRRPVMNARERAVLVMQPGVEEDEVHPILHELSPLLEQAPLVRFQSERLVDTGPSKLAGRTIGRVQSPGSRLPVPRRSWTVPAGSISKRPVEAATSVELLLGCPYAWTLQYSAGLRPSRRSEIPQGENLLGRLAHALSAEIFQSGPPPKPEIARRLAEQRLPVLIDEMATPLRLPGAAADHARALDRLPAAVEALAARLETLNAVVLGTEVECEGADTLETGVALKGRIDMLIDVTGRSPAVLDMKWSRVDRYRRKIAEGRALQLAVYGRLVGAEQAPAPAAYFMLAQTRVLPADANLFGAAASPEAPALGSVWQATKESWRARMRRLEQGTVEALSEGLLAERRDGEQRDNEAAPLPLNLEPPCKFCDKTLLCGHVRVA